MISKAYLKGFKHGIIWAGTYIYGQAQLNLLELNKASKTAPRGGSRMKFICLNCRKIVDENKVYIGIANDAGMAPMCSIKCYNEFIGEDD